MDLSYFREKKGFYCFTLLQLLRYFLYKEAEVFAFLMLRVSFAVKRCNVS